MNIEMEKSKYALKMEELLKNVNEAETVEAKVKLFEEFTNKYTTLPKIWREWAQIINTNVPVEEQKNNKKKLWIKSMSHFYSKFIVDDIFQLLPELNKDLIWNKIFYRQLQWGIKDVKPLLYYLQNVKKSLSLPNDKLKDYMEFYEEFSTKPISPEVYQIQQKSKILFGEIFSYFPYQNEWMFNMKKVGDDKFVIQNIERELTINYGDKRIWLAYIEFLKEKPYWKWLLNVYSRFCRFFIDDLEMKTKYQNEIEKLDFDAKKWKIDLIKIEKDFGTSETSLNLMETYFGKEITENEFESKLKSMEPDESGPTIPDYAIDETGFAPFRTTKAVPLKLNEKQTFALPPNLLYSILQKSDSRMLQKLHSSSKQLYLMTKIPICHRLEINEVNSTVSFEQSLFMSVKDIQIGNAEKLFLTNSLVLSSGNRNLLTEFIPKIYKCNVRFLKICLQNLSMKDFDFLVENVEKFASFDSTIRRKNEILSITEIIDRMPKLSHMTFTSSGRVKLFNAAKTVKQMHKEKEAKLDYLYIRTIPAVADPLEICNFIWKNAAPNSRFYIELKAPREYVENLDDVIKMEFNKWIPENEKPCIIITKEIVLGHI